MLLHLPGHHKTQNYATEFTITFQINIFVQYTQYKIHNNTPEFYVTENCHFIPVIAFMFTLLLFFFFVIIQVYVHLYALVLVKLSNNVEYTVCIHCHICIPPVSALNVAGN
jgi:hypothetical protein